ncbi:hypothetical protein ABIA22_003205 [Sinorhizobium fredii]|uniref:hypothetical protein n=1 Tax=Rhizobium fredii TaxID=380 RepID=UPI0035111522
MNKAISSDTTGQQVSEDEMLLRLVWDPDDIDPETQELLTSAFSKDDLKSVERGLSVDQKASAEEKCILCIAQRQQSNAEGHATIKRTTPLLAEAKTQDVTSQTFDDDGTRIFAVISTPMGATEDCPENPAHAEILNISGRKSKGYLNQMRTKLQKIFAKPQAMGAFFSETQETSSTGS